MWCICSAVCVSVCRLAHLRANENLVWLFGYGMYMVWDFGVLVCFVAAWTNDVYMRRKYFMVHYRRRGGARFTLLSFSFVLSRDSYWIQFWCFFSVLFLFFLISFFFSCSIQIIFVLFSPEKISCQKHSQFVLLSVLAWIMLDNRSVYNHCCCCC